MTRENIIMEITTKNDGILANMAIVMIDEAFKKNDSNIVCWKREGRKIRVCSTREEITDVINSIRFNRYQKSVLIYTELKK